MSLRPSVVAVDCCDDHSPKQGLYPSAKPFRNRIFAILSSRYTEHESYNLRLGSVE